MASERFKGWLDETKKAVDDAEAHSSDWHIGKAVIYALLTIAIAIHEAAETKRK
jgi:hypothetical protein